MDIPSVSAEGRTLGGWDFFWLWAGVAISLAEIWAGGFLAPMGFWLAFWAIILGHVFGNTLMALGGVIGSDHGIRAMVSVRPSATLVTDTAEPHMQMLELMGALGLAVPALLMVVFSTITSDFPDLYSATCSMLNVSDQIKADQIKARKISAKAFLWITGIVSILIALVFPMERYESFLYFIGAMFVPLFGIVLTDYFLVRKRDLDVNELYKTRGSYWYSNGFNVTALIAWVAGFATYKLIETLQYPIGASLPSFVVSAVLYYCGTLVRPRPCERTRPAVFTL